MDVTACGGTLRGLLPAGPHSESSGWLLQLRLPPEGVPAPLARASAAVAGGSPVVETLASTSLWAVATLKALSQVNMHHVCSGFKAHKEIYVYIRS